MVSNGKFLKWIFIVFLCAFITQPVFAREKAWDAQKVETPGINTITVYEIDKETGALDPSYYQIEVIKKDYERENLSGRITDDLGGADLNKNFMDIEYNAGNTPAFGGAINNSTSIGDITGNFVNNTAVSESNIVYGGNIYNTGTIGNITGDFVENKANGAGPVYGAVIANIGNGSVINDITGNFIGNYGHSEHAIVYGGAIYNEGHIGNISGDFINNIIEAPNPTYGGAVHNAAGAVIKNIDGDFIGNAAEGGGPGYGGAIYNDGKIGDLTSHFIGNHLKVDSSPALGGAIYNTGEIGNITGSFIENYAISGNSTASGGAVYNDRSGKIGNIAGSFIKNYALSSTNSFAAGGAVYSQGTIGNIDGDFVQNYAKGENNSYGGAIYNSAALGDITGSFIENYASATSEHSSAEGGAIYSTRTIGNITGNFVKNYVTANYGNGGAIYINGTAGNITGNFIQNYILSQSTSQGGAIYASGTIESIAGDFVQNYVKSTESNAQGGAIYNGYHMGFIEGNFVDNYVEAQSSANGGAIYNTSTAAGIKGNFIGNHAISQNNSVKGGAIYTMGMMGNIEGSFINNYISGGYGYGGAIINEGSSGDITGDFVNNYVKASEHGFGGAIYNGSGNIGNITGFFAGNYVDAHNIAQGGAINNVGYIKSITGDFAENHVKSETSPAHGGAIHNIGQIDNITGSFVNNYAKSESSDYLALGGAIYTSGNLNINSDNSQIVFSGNYTEDSRGKTPNAIFVDTYSPVELTLKAENNGTIIFDDQIDGGEVNGNTIDRTNSYTLNLTGDNTGKIVLNNSVINAKVDVKEINLHLGKNDVFANSDFTMHSGSLNLINGIAQEQIMQSANIEGNINMSVDVDLANQKMDTLAAGTVVDPNAKISVEYLNLLNDAKQSVTDIFFAPSDYAEQVAYTGESPIAYSPIWKYDVSYNPQGGSFKFVRSDYNPSVLPAPVATQAGGYTTQMQTFNYAFQHSDNFMSIPSLERVAMKNRNRYALSPTGDATDVGTFSPLLTKHEHNGFWVKPYASFESIPLKNGPKVGNINYGTLIGYDSDLKEMRYGVDRVLTGYIGYNGASQRYSGIDTAQNGGVLGGTATLYKGNFFNATTLSVGASAGNSNTMYGSENYTMLLAGIGNKTGYNFEFKDGKVILQPSFLISYTFVNTFDYTNAAGLRIKSDPLNAIQLAPGIKLIGNLKNGWQPYIGVNMVWNLLDKSKVMADDVRLPEMSIKPYVQYGVGVQKCFKEDKMTAYGQAMVNSGGRNGVALSVGLRWKIGK